jgi:BirA family transcriptional regulator, biotin operon repressor / biotin---[acetyl-CoA-carboxylase] ligase
VKVLDPAGAYEGTARGINARGELLVEREGELVLVSSGEVSVRGIYGYV